MGRVIKGARFRDERYALEIPEIVVPPIELPSAVDFESPSAFGFDGDAAFMRRLYSTKYSEPLVAIPSGPMRRPCTSQSRIGVLSRSSATFLRGCSPALRR